MDRNLVMTTLLAKLSAAPLIYTFQADVATSTGALSNFVGDATLLRTNLPLSGPGIADDVFLTATSPPTMSQPGNTAGSQVTITQGLLGIGQRLKFWTETNDQPFGFLVEGDDLYPPRPSSAPARVNMRALFWIYNKVKNKNLPPGPMLNALIDAVETVLLPPVNSPTGVWQSLGLESVIHARIEGEVLKDPGHLDGQGIARIPLIVQVAQGQITR